MSNFSIDFNNMKNNFLQELQKIFKNKLNSELVINIKNNNQNSAYQKEIEQVKQTIESAQNFQVMKNDILKNITNSEQQKNALDLLETFKNAQPFAQALSADTKELQSIYASAMKNMSENTKTFGENLKQTINELKNYFIKSLADAVANGIIKTFSNDEINSLFNNFGQNNNFLSSSAGIFANLFSSIFGKHHSGGYIPNGTGTLPGTSEYLSVLKGGERVLSPAENSALNNSSATNKQNVVINNFNVQAWNSKDVQQYLLENKDILAGITADNIKYNNANLRYMINQT